MTAEPEAPGAEAPAQPSVLDQFDQAAREMGAYGDQPTADPAIEPPPVDSDPGDETPAAQPERPRDEQGRFAAQVDTDALSEQAAAFLARYDGDPQKALDAAAHYSSAVGRQGQELGELRAVKEELQALRQELGQPEAVEMDDAARSWIEEDPVNAVQWVKQEAAQGRNHPQVWQQAMQELRTSDPGAYADEMIQLHSQQLRHEFEQRLAPAQQNLETQSMGLAIRAAAADYPEFNDPAYIEKLLQHPRAALIAPQLSTGDVNHRAEVLRTLADAGRSWYPPDSAPAAAIPNGTAPAEHAPVAPAAAAIAAFDPRTSAQVATGGFAPSREAPTGLDQFHQRFQEIARELGAMPTPND